MDQLNQEPIYVMMVTVDKKWQKIEIQREKEVPVRRSAVSARYWRKHLEKTLSAMEEQGKEPGKMASAWSWMSTEMRMMAKGGDKEAASIVTDGCNMGIKTICGYKNQYSGASKAVMEIADELTGMEENLRDHMKKFL